MTIKELYNELLEAYAAANLNAITRKLILLYKSKNYGKIREIANKISKYVEINEEKDAKCFSKLIMLYHPDKGDSIRAELTRLYEQNNFESLQKYSHILILANIDKIAIEAIDQSIEYNPEYVWEPSNEDGYIYSNEYSDDGTFEETEYDEFERSFFNLIKIREYGRVDVEVPTYYFEDFEEFEMEGSGLELLDGVEYCIHVKILDISNNNLTDISNLWGLEYMEELYLANNQIGYIDILSNLTHLKIVDLAGNQIDDISPLLCLENLEYVNLAGNPVSVKQVKELEAKGVVVC